MQEQEILFNHMVNPPAADPADERRSRRAQRKDSKKSRILGLFHSGVTDIGEIARTVPSRPSYVASVLQEAGLIHGYFDLYTTTAHDQNLYSRHFRNVLSFKTVEAAKESVARIARLYSYFERIGDRAGQHHAEVLALTGRNRARWSGKKEESHVFEQWLFNH
ncbi:MAG: hypothetical protein ACLGJB_24615 [Blastocatellia bacterium]